MPAAPPYLGAAYYPEDWPLAQIDQDIALMQQAGMNVMRVGEFAWSRMEPEEGRYDLDWLNLAVEKLTRAKIAVIMCTPTCTPPVWLTEKYSEVLVMDGLGVRQQHGGRRHACPTSPVYRGYCAKIVTRLAEEFGQNDNIIGWQIDNELYPGGPHIERKPAGCYCPSCRKQFLQWLQRRFRTIRDLNQAWGTDLWSQTYQTFEQVPLPRPDGWHHPSLLTAWMEFQSDAYVEFAAHQADILHRLTRHPVGTDMMPFNGLNYHHMHRHLDVAQFNHYNASPELWKAAFWMDFLRPLKDLPFWNTETSTGCSASTVVAPGHGYREPGFCRVNSWLPIALGGEANCYWLWRAHWSGQELVHGSVVDSCGRPLHMFNEVREISDGFRAAADFLNNTRVKDPGLALHFSGLAWLMFEFQPLVPELRYGRILQEAVYRPLWTAHLGADVIDPAADLDPYRVVLSPLLPALDEAALRERLQAWIENGGTWIAGPLTDNRTVHAAKFTRAPFGSLEEWAGIYTKYQVPGVPRQFTLRANDGAEGQGALWYDGFELKGAQALATYTDGPLAGLAAVAEKKMGKGRIITLGTLLPTEFFARLVLQAAQGAGLAPAAAAGPNVLTVVRSGDKREGLVALEMNNQPSWLTLAGPMTDLLTGKKHQGKIEMQPYQVMVLKK
jgi:beta-galactosidase GanA